MQRVRCLPCEMLCSTLWLVPLYLCSDFVNCSASLWNLRTCQCVCKVLAFDPDLISSVQSSSLNVVSLLFNRSHR